MDGEAPSSRESADSGARDLELAGQRTVTVVIPTFNRCDTLRRTLPERLRLHGVSRVIVVVDGSTDDTKPYLDSVDDDRLTVVHQPNSGAPAARNRGWDLVDTEWTLFTDDDDFVPPNYVEVLMSDADASGADVISGPNVDLVNKPATQQSIEGALAAEASEPSFRRSQEVIPPGLVETPMLTMNALVRTRVREVVRFNEAYTGPAWREETDFFLRCRSNDLRLVLTPHTATGRTGNASGGARQGTRLLYEVRVIKSNSRFLRHWGPTLVAQGDIASTTGEQARFILARLASVLVDSAWSIAAFLRRPRRPPSAATDGDGKT